MKKKEEKLHEMKNIINALDVIREGICNGYFDDTFGSTLESIEILDINITNNYQKLLKED